MQRIDGSTPARREALQALLRRDALEECVQEQAAVRAIIADVRDTDAIERAREVALGWIDEARRLLAMCSDDVERDLLEEVARSVVDRFA